MPDQVAGGANVANAPGAVVSNVPHRGVVAAARAKAGRGDTLRMIQSGQLDASSARPSVPAQPPIVEPAAQLDPEAMPDVEQTVDDGSSAEIEQSAAPEPVMTAPDSETAKRLAQIQAAEKRQREKADRARAEIDDQRKKLETEWAPRVKAAEDFERIRASARKSPAHLVEAVRALGLGDDDFEAAAQALYASSKAGAADPARKAAAERMMREREQTTEISETQKRIADLEAKLEQRDQQAKFESLRTSWLDQTVDAITDEAPIARAALAAIEKAKSGTTPADKQRAQQLASKLRSRLWDVTKQMADENEGEVPDFADVITRFEDVRGAELDELGIPRPTATSTTTTKQNDKTADKQTPARTLSNDLSTTRVPRPAQSGDAARKDSRRETLRALESGKLD